MEGSKTKRTEITTKGSNMHFFSLKRGKKKNTFKVSGFVLNKDLFLSLSIRNYTLSYYLKVMVTSRKALYVTVLIC